MEKVIGVILTIVVGLPVIVAVLLCGCLILAWPFMWIWNYAIVSAVTIANPIEYWTAFWMMFFVSFYVKSSTSSSSD